VGIPDGERTMDNAYFQQHNLEETRNRARMSVQGMAWQATAAKMCHNLRHTGARHGHWYSE
jgi:hypothetical protein